MHEIAKNMSSTMGIVERSEHKVNGKFVPASVLTKKSVQKVLENTFCMMGCACFWNKFPKKLRERKQLWQLRAPLAGCCLSCSLGRSCLRLYTAWENELGWMASLCLMGLCEWCFQSQNSLVRGSVVTEKTLPGLWLCS